MSYYRQPPSRVYGVGAGLPPVTPVVKAIMIACAGIWLLQFVVRLVQVERFGQLAWDPSDIFGIVPWRVAQGWIWQLATYMFLHSTSSLAHLLINMLVLYMVGGDLERHWGAARFLRYYLICGIGAGVFVTVGGLLTNPLAPTIGASGAIYGVLLAFGMIFSERVLLFMLLFPIRARTMCWILFAIAFLSTWSESAGGVSHVAHLGGMVVGYLYLKRVWHLGEFYRELRWKLRRRRFRVMPPGDQDRWTH